MVKRLRTSYSAGMKLSDFDFELPDDLIATRPASPRSSARLLVAEGDVIHDGTVTDLVDWLQPGDRLVLNDTKVIPARLSGLRHRNSAQGAVAAKIEVTLLEPRADGSWSALLKPLKKIKVGEDVVFGDGFSATLVGIADGQGLLRFNLAGDDFDAALAEAGAMPLPPYIASQRPVDTRDDEDYQTMFAAEDGAVAAPTAGLHFTPAMIQALEDKGVQRVGVTLHVGAGTFLPVKVENTEDHKMHSEIGEITSEAAAKLNEARTQGGRIIAVGTTSLRLLESATDAGGMIKPFKAATDIFISPGYKFRAVDVLMTNFHLPKSTLFMLVSAFSGLDQMKKAYETAISEGYRFYSYGDSSLLFPKEEYK